METETQDAEPVETGEVASRRVQAGLHATLAVFAVLVIWESVRIGFGSLSQPGPGFMALLCGLALLAATVPLLVQAIVAQRRASLAPESRGSGWTAASWSTVAVLGGIAAYTVAIPLVGYGVSTTAFALGMLWVQGWRGWRALIAAVLISGSTAALFVGLLAAPFPKLFGLI